MALDTDALTSELLTLFSAPPTTAAECADQWASAMQSFSENIIPVSTTVAAAASTLATTLTTIFETSVDRASTAAQMESAFLTFATSVGAGMQPTYTALPPPGAVGFATLFTLLPLTADEAVNNFVSAIDPWMKTGTATRNSAPFDTVSWT